MVPKGAAENRQIPIVRATLEFVRRLGQLVGESTAISAASASSSRCVATSSAR